MVLQFDGLAEPILRRALAEGLMPTLAAWISSGSHRLAAGTASVPDDHGRCTGHLFRRVYGQPLDALVRGLFDAESTEILSCNRDDGRGHNRSFLNDIVHGSGLVIDDQRQRSVRMHQPGGPVDLTLHTVFSESASQAKIVVSRSRTSEHIFFARPQGVSRA